MGIGKHFGSSSIKANKLKKEREFKEISWHKCQCSSFSQTPNQGNLNDYHQYLSLYKVDFVHGRTELTIYDTESRNVEVKILNDNVILDNYTSVTQLPNGELFCYGNWNSGITLIIDRNYRVRMLPSGTPSGWSSALYFDENIYCFGGHDANHRQIDLSRKFDLKKNRWIDLALLPDITDNCHSVVFNGSILISRYLRKYLWLYSIEINSFSIIPYKFARAIRKVLINIGRLYLIEWGEVRVIYESDDGYHWKRISKCGEWHEGSQMYCLYNKGKIYFSTSAGYYEFDLKKKAISRLKPS